MNMGAIPLLVDVMQNRLDRAKELGVPQTYNSGQGNIQEFLAETGGGSLPEAMLECTGSPAVIADMHNMVQHGGRVALVGWPHDPVLINTIRCMQKELDIYPCRNSNGQFPRSIGLIHEGKIPADSIITKTVTLEQTEAVIQDMIEHPADYLKVIVQIRS
jgi:threonine dehydrogenase-like Zn-dependent dehydrogenase